MSLFGHIISLQDALNRLPQFEHQINKLEKEASKSDTNLGNEYLRRCHELHKQLDEHRKRMENIKTEESYKKKRGLEQITELKEKLSNLAPEKGSVIVTDRTSKHSVESSDSEEEKLPDREGMKRRQSVMYDGDASDSDLEGSVEEPVPKPRNLIVREEREKEQHNARIEETASPPPTVPSMSNEHVVEGNTFVVLKNYHPNTAGDLRLIEGEAIRIVETRPDGWWMAQNMVGDKGLVPKNYLRHLPKPKERSKVAKRLGVRDSVIGVTPSSTTNVEPITCNHGSTDAFGSAIAKWTGKRVECLGDAYRCDAHLSYSCHLAPRLSRSNLAYHDLFWNKDHDQVRKRNIRISRILRIVRLEGMPLIGSKALIRVALFDENRQRGRQIVSNVHTLVPRVKGTTWHLLNKQEQIRSCAEFSDIVLRSNYSLPHVVLIIEASTILPSQNGFEEKSLGLIRIPLIGANGEPTIVSRTYVEHLKEDNLFMSSTHGPRETTRRMFFKVMEVQKERVHFIDSMPDILIFNALYIPFFYYYRRRAGTILLRDSPNPLSSEMVSNPLLSVFPNICDQHDVMDALLNLWSDKKKILNKKTEIDQTIEFFQTFLHTAFFIYGTYIMPVYEIADDVAMAGRQKAIKLITDALKKGNVRNFLSAQNCNPINIFDYSLDLFGAHSLD